MNRTLIVAGGFAAFALFHPGAASAQNSGAQPSRAIEEIVVTARGREETVRDIPVAITALSGEDLERYNLGRMDELGSLIPQLDIVRGNSGSGANISMRGIGSTFTSIGVEQSVAVVLDGVYFPQGRVINEGLFDVEQVAVLKGPQALYFGKNATAGVISLRTRNPGDEFETKFSAGYEFEQQRTELEGIISMPITDTFGARLALRGTKGWDGYMKNTAVPTTYTTTDVATGNMTTHNVPAPDDAYWPGEKSLSGRLTLAGDPSDNFSWNIKGAFTHWESNSPGGASTVWGCPTLDGQAQQIDPATGQPVPNPLTDCGKHWRQQYNPIPESIASVTPILNQFGGDLGEEYRSNSLTASFDYAFEQLEVTTIMNYHNQETKWVGDFDFGGRMNTFAGEANEFDAFSAEVRASTLLDGPVNFVLGGLYQKTERQFEQDVFLAGSENSAAPEPQWQYATYAKISGTDGETRSVYGEVIWDLAPAWQLTAGTRYLWENKDSFFAQPYANPAFAAVFLEGQIEADQTFKEWTPEVTLRWEAADNMTVYGAYKQGFKSGGFSNSGILSGLTANPIDDFVFDGEEVEGFEVGVKSDHFGGTVQLEAEAYYYEYSDLQIDFFNSPTFAFITENAGKAETQGAEAQVTWAPGQVEGLTLNASLGYNEAEYKDFVAPCYAGQTPAAGCNIFNPGEVPKQQISGADRPLAPKWSGALRANYETPLDNGLVLGIAGNLQFKSKFGLYPFDHPFDEQSGYVTVDATLSLRTEDYRWTAELIGRNLTDKYALLRSGDTPSTGGGTGTANGFFADRVGNPILPRTVAVRLTYNNL